MSAQQHDAAIYEKLHPREFQLKFVERGVRTDGRTLNTTRRTIISSSPLASTDSAMVRIGNTTVVCGITAEVGVPLATKPREGRLTVELQLRPSCSAKFSLGRPSEQSISVAEAVKDMIVSSRVFALDELCIAEGQAAWVLYADVVCLDYDGNVLDAAFLATVAALGNVRLPEVRLDDDGEVIITELKPYSRPLRIRHVPVPLTVGFLDGHMLHDPNATEEELVDTTCTAVYNNEGKLCTVYKPGGDGLSPEQLQTAMAAAKQHSQRLLPLMLQHVKVGGAAAPTTEDDDDSDEDMS